MISVVGSVVVDSLLPPIVMCVWGRGSGGMFSSSFVEYYTGPKSFRGA